MNEKRQLQFLPDIFSHAPNSQDEIYSLTLYEYLFLSCFLSLSLFFFSKHIYTYIYKNTFICNLSFT